MTDVDELHAPGRKRMTRPSGRVDVYWVAAPAAVKAGFSPKTVPLPEDPGDTLPPPEVAQRCRVLWAEMSEFLRGAPRAQGRFGAGTIGWLVELYQTDPDSPYRGLRASTLPSYNNALAIVAGTIGERRIETTTANDVRRWHRQWGRAGDDGIVTQPRRAYWGVQMLRVVVKFGKGQRLPGCRDLSEILTETEFSAPRGRTVAMTAGQVAAFIAKAHEMGRPSLARATALQFCGALRQKDVIGEWVAGRWSAGLLWGEHVKADWTVAKPTSKTNFDEVAEFDLTLLPLALAEMQRVEPTRRIGPVCLDEDTGKPWRQRKFARVWRTIAQAAGIPDNVWNMDARAGAVTEARAKGATREDAMALATHTQAATNRRYDRDRLAATSRVATLRFGKNEGGKGGA